MSPRRLVAALAVPLAILLPLATDSCEEGANSSGRGPVVAPVCVKAPKTSAWPKSGTVTKWRSRKASSLICPAGHWLWIRDSSGETVVIWVSASAYKDCVKWHTWNGRGCEK